MSVVPAASAPAPDAPSREWLRTLRADGATRDEAVGRVYNLGDANPLSLAELAEQLVELNGEGSWRLVPFPADRKAIDIGDFWADYAKIERDLEWRPTVELRDGLAATLAFYREHGAGRYWNEGS